MKKYLWFALSCLLIITIAGCNGPAKKSEPLVINMWVMPNSSRPVEDLNEILAGFHEQNPDIKVNVTSIDWGSAQSKINSAAISGEAPDITQLGTTWVGVISGMDALVDLSERVNEIGGADAFLPAAWTSSGIEGSGKVTAIPWFVDARALYYRTDVFKKLGLTKEDLANWDSFEKTLWKIKKANLIINNQRVEPLGSPGANDWNILHNMAPWIWGAGGDIFSDDRTMPAFQGEKSLRGVKFFVGLANEGLIPNTCLEMNTAQVSAKFNEGAYAMYFDTPAQIKNLELPPEKGGAGGTIAAQNYDVALYPRGPEGQYTFFGGSCLAIFKASKNQKAAWEVIKYLAQKESQIEYAKVTGFIPTRRDCFNHPYFTEHPKRSIFIDAVQYGRTYPCIRALGPIEPVMMRHLGNIWSHVSGEFGKYSLEEINEELNQAATEVEILIKDSVE